MNIIMGGVHLELTPSLAAYIKEKLGGLDKLIGRFEEEGEIELHIIVERTTKHHYKGRVFKAEAWLHLPRKTLRASHDATDARAAVDALRAKLRLEIEKYRELHLAVKKIRRARS